MLLDGKHRAGASFEHSAEIGGNLMKLKHYAGIWKMLLLAVIAEGVPFSWTVY